LATISFGWKLLSKDMEQYDRLEAIGAGSFGEVHRIRRKADGKVLVWKELNYGKMSEKEKQLLVSEVNILRELRNPFIVRYYDRIVDKQSTRLYIVMEHCSGGDLGKVIKQCKRERRNIDEALIWRILAQSILALKDCHRNEEDGKCKPILHRDIKPANILLDSEKNIKIGDFGLAKELSSASKLATTNVGTPFYMSPEIICEKQYDERSDIWSLGCLIYELCALRPPFDATNQITLSKKITAGAFERIPRKYSDDLFYAIRCMLQVDRRKRPKVEQLETIPTLLPYLTEARSIVSEHRGAQQQATKQRESVKKEEDLEKREKAVDAREKAVAAIETTLRTTKIELEAYQQRLRSDRQQLESERAAFDRLKQAQAQAGDGELVDQTRGVLGEQQQMPNRAAPRVPPPRRERERERSISDPPHTSNQNLPPPPPVPTSGFAVYVDENCRPAAVAAPSRARRLSVGLSDPSKGGLNSNENGRPALANLHPNANAAVAYHPSGLKREAGATLASASDQVIKKIRSDDGTGESAGAGARPTVKVDLRSLMNRPVYH